KYLELLKVVLIPEIEAADINMTFMQDNSPCHKSSKVLDFLRKNNINLLDWPPQSPDMNPIENLWAIIKARRKKKFGVPTSKNEYSISVFKYVNIGELYITS